MAQTNEGMSLKKIVEENDTKAGRNFDLVIQALIVVSLVSFSIETLPDLSASAQSVLGLIELTTVTAFTIEYLLRLVVADKKLKFVFSFFGLIDLLAIIPFYISTGIDLRSIRIFRLFRLFRIFKVLRYSKAILRFDLAFKSIKEELILFLIAVFLLIFVASIGIYYCENTAQPEHFGSFFHSLWWSIVTLTTVGYGDVYPITAAGKVFASFVMFVGVGVVAVPSGLMASSLTKVIRNEDMD
jgi:voltage-gated potassium channel